MRAAGLPLVSIAGPLIAPPLAAQTPGRDPAAEASPSKEDADPLTRAGLALLLVVLAGAARLRLSPRLAGPLGVMLVVGALAAPAAHAEPSLAYACSPSPSNCAGWYRSAVTLSWDWDQLAAAPSAGNCNARSFTSDTKGTETFCEIRDSMTLEKVRRTLTIRIDRAPPTLSVAPDRPPDSNGWFNHPVALAFQGSDATSGVASCTGATYGGPEGLGVAVSGSCTDVAGNVGSGSFALNYDDSPPGTPRADLIPGDNLVRIGWSTPKDAVAVEVARVGPGADEVVYLGGRGRAVDRGLENGVRHRYRVTALDRAGNRASTSKSAVPTASDLLTPVAGGRRRDPPLLAWRKVRKASYYNVQLFRGERKILSRWPRANRLQLERRWRFGGARFRLSPGTYTWYIWPAFGKRGARDYGRLLGRRTFTITR